MMHRVRVLTTAMILIAIVAAPTAVFSASTDEAKQPVTQKQEPNESIQTAQPVFIPMSQKAPFKFYGFISAEAMWSSQQLSSFGNACNIAANGGVSPYNRNMAGFNRVIDYAEGQKGDRFIDFTVQNTRFGFLLDPYDFGGKPVSVDSRLEMDFWRTDNNSIASVVPRIRRAYAGIGQTSWRVLFGQEWDVFSPLNTGTLNIGNDMWRQGNLGFRRPQIRFTYNQPIGDKNGIEAVGSVNIPSNSMSFDDSGNTTSIPMEEGRVGFWHDMQAGKMWAYVSALYARHNNAIAGSAVVNNWSVALSLNVPFHKYVIPSGEFHYGYSLGDLLSDSDNNRRERTIAGWGQIKSQWLDWLETNVGYGMDHESHSQVQTGWIWKNQLIFANVMFRPLKPFVIGLEYNNLRTSYKGSGTSSANVVFSNVIFYF